MHQDIIRRMQGGKRSALSHRRYRRLGDRIGSPTPEQRSRFEIIGSGSGIHWPEVDEDISVEGMLHGIPARRPKK
jgi:hypothetical protein